MTQDENLHVLVPIAHGEQPQRGESIRDGQVRQAKEHSGSSCLTRFCLRVNGTRVRHTKPSQSHDLGGCDYRQAQCSGAERSWRDCVNDYGANDTRQCGGTRDHFYGCMKKLGKNGDNWDGKRFEVRELRGTRVSM
ncbi:hypothetical protein GCM10022419_130830 [Nonomuraea rosea]|uniref:Uncharacterized protein n=1 Tax=Nonomuraea rosea TaxID=638574 RepID=A0ABP7A117_9ACTN